MKNTGKNHYFIFLFSLITGLILLVLPLGAQVYEDELGIGTLGPVEFINFEGPFLRLESRQQIRDIGNQLGLAVRAGNMQPGALNRYFVIHSMSEADGFRLDADIFGLGVDTAVDHIRNLRFIIQGYLEGAYGYSENDAALLAHYITIYDAVYRGDWNHFSNRYKNPVLSHLTQERVGLAIRYDEWPGRSLIVIPLTGLGGSLSAIDTTIISDQRVLEQLRDDPDMSLDLRRDMVDLMEREADQAALQAEITREAIRQEEERLAEERRLALLAEQEAREREQQARREQDEEAARLAMLQQEEARARQAELDREREALEAMQREAERQEAFAEDRLAAAQEGRQQIAEDQQVLIRQEGRPEAPAGVLALSIATPNSTLGHIVRIDSSTGTVILRSAINTVNVRTVHLINNRIIAIAGENRGANTAIRLVEFDSSTLQMHRQGDNDIIPESLLWVNGQDLYALVNMDGTAHLARFNIDLVQQARSSISVNPFASVFFSEGYIATKRADGSAVLLDSRSLVESR